MAEAVPVVTVSIDGTRKHGRCGSAITDTLNLEGGFHSTGSQVTAWIVMVLMLEERVVESDNAVSANSIHPQDGVLLQGEAMHSGRH